MKRGVRDVTFRTTVGVIVAREGGGKSNAAGATCRLRVTKVILGKYDNTPLAYTPGLELHHPIMSKIGGHGGQLESERESGQSKLLASLSANNT